MPPPTTLKQFRTSEKDSRQAGVTDLQAALVAVDATLAVNRLAVAVATDVLADLQEAEVVLRLAVAAALMPAEAAAKLVDLEANLMAQREAAAKLTAAQDALTRSEQERARTSALLDLERARLTQAIADLAIATAVTDQTDAWKTALKAPELVAAVAESKKAATTALVTGAETTLKTLLGGKAEILRLLQDRFADAASAVVQPAADAGRLVDALDALQKARSAVDGAVLEAATAFGRARDAAREVTETAVQQFVSAKGALQAAAAAALPPGDPAVIDPRAAAATAAAKAESLVHTTRLEERARLAALDAAALAKEAADPTFKRDTLPEFAAWNTAKAAREQAETDFTGTMKTTLDMWEVAIPPPLMATVVAYLRAVAVIGRLKDIDLGKLVTALTDTEKTYAAALEARASADRLREAAGQKVAARLDDALAAAKVNDLRLAALVRGDA